jgi:hypothetical protein
MRWAEDVARMGEMRGVYSVLVKRPEEKRQFGRPRHIYYNNIKVDI